MLVNEETAKEIIPRFKKGETTLAGGAAGSILGGVALLDMPSGDLWLSQSQRLAVQGLELSCPGAARR